MTTTTAAAAAKRPLSKENQRPNCGRQRRIFSSATSRRDV
jgi:hypothetical protein